MKRPVQNIGGIDVPMTLPPGELNPAEAMAAAIAARPGYDRRNDATAVNDAAKAFAAEVFLSVAGDLAFLARERATLSSESGWEARLVDGPSPQAVDLLIEHPEEPGGWLVSIHFREQFTPEASERHDALLARKRQEWKDMGKTEKEIMIMEIFDRSAEIKAFGKDRANYRPARPGDRIERLSGTALNLGARGYPEAIEASDASPAREVLPLRKHPEGWWRGIALEISPQIRPSGEDMPGTADRGRSGFLADLQLLRILGDLADSNGFGERMDARTRELAATSWVHFGDERRLALAEAGLAVATFSGGRIDGAVLEELAHFSSWCAAHDLGQNLEDIEALGRNLIAAGVTSRESAYDCNDLRDIGHAGQGEDGALWLRTETQHGTYRLEIRERQVLAYREPGTLVGRFARGPGGLEPDYGPAADGAGGIPHTARMVRDMNGIIASLASMACCFDEDHPKEDETPAP
ncbi:hypothetical protein [Defluviimonas salinarum]|uniref:Uncharacterized protein n=1 Tax=Defluviimonas salinarum TaxID=2992147 RepID=A0ABT3J9F3_9RHOB|nr:hypothetical protein [Defluviimonas salinarum]MCW3784319.1 hypothetical protein [Defluviimonas salinarum]